MRIVLQTRSQSSTIKFIFTEHEVNELKNFFKYAQYGVRPILNYFGVSTENREDVIESYEIINIYSPHILGLLVYPDRKRYVDNFYMPPHSNDPKAIRANLAFFRVQRLKKNSDNTYETPPAIDPYPETFSEAALAWRDAYKHIFGEFFIKFKIHV
ncbi:MAG: hypothetical protein QXP36_14800 [Conexivisphaerales archaeon]